MSENRTPRNLFHTAAWVLLATGLLGWLWTGEWRWAVSGVVAGFCSVLIGGAVTRVS